MLCLKDPYLVSSHSYLNRIKIPCTYDKAPDDCAQSDLMDEHIANLAVLSIHHKPTMMRRTWGFIEIMLIMRSPGQGRHQL